MTPRRTSRVLVAIAVVGLAAAALGGCAGINNPFGGAKSTSKASPGERISLLELNDQLKVSDSLKGQDFFLPAPQPMAEWPLPGGTPEQSVENVAAAPDFEIAWRRSFGDASNRRRHVTAPPIMAEGKVFVMDAMADVSAHDALSGAQIWRVNLMPKSKRDREAFGGGLAYDGGKVYATSGFRVVAAIDAKTGHVDWVTHTEAPIHDAPTVSAGRVFAVDVDDQLMSFLTAGEDECRAWTIPVHTPVVKAAGAIHSDFEKKFIRAEVVNWKALVDHRGYPGVREKGLLRLEGKEYIVKDGDVLVIRHS